MNMTIRSKVIKIGNSRGIRIPRAVLDQIGLVDEVEMKVDGDQLIIKSSHHPRQDWAMQFAKMTEEGDDRMLDEATAIRWDDEEWTW